MSNLNSNLKLPEGLNLIDWWQQAQCLGMPVELLSKHDCWGCPVQRECLWVAVTDDDRITDRPLFIRGGLSATKREDLWWWKDRNPLATYDACIIEAERSEFDSQRRRKNKKYK